MKFNIAASVVACALLCLLVAVIAATNEKTREPINVLPKRTSEKMILMPSCAQISSIVSTSDGSKKVREICSTMKKRSM